MVRSEHKKRISYGFGFLISVGVTMVALFAINGILLHWILIETFDYQPSWLQTGGLKLAFQTIVPVIAMALQYTFFDWCTISSQPSHEDS